MRILQTLTLLILPLSEILVIQNYVDSETNMNFCADVVRSMSHNVYGDHLCSKIVYPPLQFFNYETSSSENISKFQLFLSIVRYESVRVFNNTRSLAKILKIYCSMRSTFPEMRTSLTFISASDQFLDLRFFNAFFFSIADTTSVQNSLKKTQELRPSLNWFVKLLSVIVTTVDIKTSRQ